MNSIQLIPEFTPRCELSFRLATMDDLPAIDALQKKHSKGLGFFPRAQMEGYITNEWVLVAEDAASRKLLGYCASRDRYLKRDELGVIYQLCVEPGTQRKLVGAALIKAVFERSAYGCRLYCCWCAKDLDANYFWESIGFVPIAFRGGSEKKSRVHVFWQKRIVEGDVETKWWYPSQTTGGAMRADRIAFPIPPGVSWRDVEAVSVPNSGVGVSPALEGPNEVARGRDAHATSRKKKQPPVMQAPTMRRPQFNGPDAAAIVVVEAPVPAKVAEQKRERACPEQSRRAPRVKIDPKYIAAARELRDRWLERVNADPMALTSNGKYHVARALSHVQDAQAFGTPTRPMLAA